MGFILEKARYGCTEWPDDEYEIGRFACMCVYTSRGMEILYFLLSKICVELACRERKAGLVRT